MATKDVLITEKGGGGGGGGGEEREREVGVVEGGRPKTEPDTETATKR